MHTRWNKKIQDYAKHISDYARMLEQHNDSELLPYSTTPQIEKLVADVHGLFKSTMKYAAYVERTDVTTVEKERCPKPGTEESLISSIMHYPDGIKINVAALPSKSNNKSSQYSRILRNSMLGIPANMREEIMNYKAVDVVFRRVHLSQSRQFTYDLDNGAYSAVINALQGVLLKSERIEYLKTLSLIAEIGCDDHLEIEIRNHAEL